jgi:hypothetical protein
MSTKSGLLGQCYGTERHDLVNKREDEGILSGPIPEAARLNREDALKIG